MKPNTMKIKIAHLALAITWRLAALITGALLALLILGSLS